MHLPGAHVKWATRAERPEGARTTSGLSEETNAISSAADQHHFQRARLLAAHRRPCSTWVDARRSARAPLSRMLSPRTKPSVTAWCARRPTRRAHPKMIYLGGRARVTFLRCVRSREGRGASPPRRRGGSRPRALAIRLFRRPGRASRFSSIAPRLLPPTCTRPRLDPHPPESAATVV